MNIFCMIVGGLTLIACSIALLAYAYNVVSEWHEYREKQLYVRTQDKIIHRLGLRLVDESYYFSESKETFNALNLLGLALAQDAAYDIFKIRNAWRQELARNKEGAE